MTRTQKRLANVAQLNAAFDEVSRRTQIENVLLGLIPIIVVDLFAGCGGASQGLLRALKLAGLAPETLRERGFYLRLLNINHWEISIETIRRNIAFAELYNASIENWDPALLLEGVRPHLLIAAPECIMYSKARGKRKIKDQSRTTAAWVLDWVRQQPHAIYLENVWEWTTWGPLDDDDNPIKERMGEYFDGFTAELRSLGYSNYSYDKFCCANYGDPTSRERFFGLAWHDEYALPASSPPQTHTAYPSRYPHLKKHVAIRTCLDLNRPSQMITERDTIHVPPTLRRIKSGFVMQNAWDSPLFGAICDRMEPISASAHRILNARPSESKLGRKLTRDEQKRNKRILDAVRARTRRQIRAAAAVSLGHFEPHEVPLDTLRAIEVIIGQHAGGAPRTVDQPIMTIDCGGGTGVAQGFLVKANASEKSAFDDATQMLDCPKRTIVAKECAALAEPALLIVQHGEDDVRIVDKDKPGPTLAGNNGLGIAQTEFSLAQPTIVNLYSGNLTGNGAAPAANTSIDDPLGSVLAGGNHHGLAETVLLRCFGEKTQGETRAQDLSSPIGALGAGGNQSAVAQPVMEIPAADQSTCEIEEPTQEAQSGHSDDNSVLVQPTIATLYGQSKAIDIGEPIGSLGTNNQQLLAQAVITKNYGERHESETRATALDETIDAIPGTAKHGLAQPTLLPQHFNADPQSLDEPHPPIVAINRTGLAQPSIHSTHFGNKAQSIEEPSPGATTASGCGMAVTQPVITQNFGERKRQRPRSRTIDETGFATTSHGAGMLAQTHLSAKAPEDVPIMFFFTIGTLKIYINIRYRMLHSSELAKAHSLGHVEFAGTETDAIRQIGNSIPAKTAAAFITHALRPVLACIGLQMAVAA